MGKLTNLNPVAQITDADIPAGITRDIELTAEIAAHLNSNNPHFQYLQRSGIHDHYNATGSIDDYTTGLASKDANLDGVTKGWHLLTLMRANDSNFGIQWALCDTHNGIKYRRKSWGVWQSWVTIA